MATRGMNSVGNLAMIVHLLPVFERSWLVLHASGVVRRKSAGDDQSHAAFGPLGVEASQLLETFRVKFQARVHRAHDEAVRQRRTTYTHRLKEQRPFAIHAF